MYSPYGDSVNQNAQQVTENKDILLILEAVGLKPAMLFLGGLEHDILLEILY